MEIHTQPCVLRTCIFVGRGELVTAQTNQGMSFTDQKFTCQAQQHRCYRSITRMFCTRVYVILWFSTHSYYAMHLFPRPVTGVKGEGRSVQVFRQLVRGLHVAALEQAH